MQTSCNFNPTKSNSIENRLKRQIAGVEDETAGRRMNDGWVATKLRGSFNRSLDLDIAARCKGQAVTVRIRALVSPFRGDVGPRNRRQLRSARWRAP
jgi:hypothetical protein